MDRCPDCMKLLYQDMVHVCAGEATRMQVFYTHLVGILPARVASNGTRTQDSSLGVEHHVPARLPVACGAPQVVPR